VIREYPIFLPTLRLDVQTLTVPSIGEERVFTVAKPELKVAVMISGIFSFIY
jgi:hypothetical protein